MQLLNRFKTSLKLSDKTLAPTSTLENLLVALYHLYLRSTSKHNNWSTKASSPSTCRNYINCQKTRSRCSHPQISAKKWIRTLEILGSRLSKLLSQKFWLRLSKRPIGWRSSRQIFRLPSTMDRVYSSIFLQATCASTWVTADLQPRTNFRIATFLQRQDWCYKVASSSWQF